MIEAVDVVAIGAVSPLGVGDDAWRNGELGQPARVAIARDEALVAAGLRKPFAARTRIAGDGDPATRLLLAAFAQIEEAIPRDVRLGLSIGTSSGGMASAERLFAARARGETIDAKLASDATYHAPFRALVDRVASHGHRVARACHPLTACSASTLAIGLGMRWLAAGDCDVVIAGGYDALTTFVAAGFEALGATTATIPPRPFRIARDGMSLGEGAGLFVLMRAGQRPAPPAIARLLGFGASGDAVHLTAPDRTGAGLARAATRALQEAAIDRASIDLVSVHGTSTPFNDPMESKAIARALGEIDRDPPVVHAGKATLGHTLGAAGVLESALAIDALRRGLLPATAGEGDLDPELAARPASTNERANVRAVLKLSAAFGGANAALVIGPASAPGGVKARAIESEEIASAAVDAVDLDALATSLGMPRERLGRMDGVCHLALASLAALAERVGRDRLRGAGIVLGTTLATIDVNAVYDEGMRKKGAAHAEGRRFAYTTPNAAAGECAIAFGLTGPNLAVGRGFDAAIEANEIARDLVRAGDAERVVVIEVDADGPCARTIARALEIAPTFGARARLISAR